MFHNFFLLSKITSQYLINDVVVCEDENEQEKQDEHEDDQGTSDFQLSGSSS